MSGNKYRAQANESRRRRKVNRMCGQKRRYDSEEAAYQKGQRSYACPHCGGWHRSGKFAELVATVKKRKPKP